MSGRTIDVGDGLTLHVDVRGSGAPLLLVHGFTGSGDSWSGVRESLAHRCTTIAIDLPGHGRSSAPRDAARYALSRLADDLATVLDALRIDRAAVLGYSLGGRAALRFALAHPARVRALVLESASPGIDDPAAAAERRVSDLALADGIERNGIEWFVSHWEQLPLWASQSALPAHARSALRAQRLRNDPRGLANSLRGAGTAAEPAVTDRLATLAMPVLLLAGSLDARYVTIAEAMLRRIPHARLQVLRDAGHAAHLEQPAAFADAVAAFLATQVTSARDEPRPIIPVPAR